MCKSSNILCKNRVRRLKPWMTAGILTSVRERDNLANDKGNLESRQTHISYVTKLTYLLEKFKDDYYSQKFTNPGNGYKKTWMLPVRLQTIKNQRKMKQWQLASMFLGLVLLLIQLMPLII
nr:unnamed protein product [Callosobruchus chinensis]